MIDFFYRHKPTVLLAIFTAASFFLMALRVGPIVNACKISIGFLISPSIVSTGDFFNRLDASTGRFFDLIRTEAENTLLRAQNTQLANKEVERDALQEENNRLRMLLDLRQKNFPDGIGAEVIGRDVRDWFRVVSINKGSDNKIPLAGAVVSVATEKPTLVGRVAELQESSSKVMLLTDSLSAVSVRVVRTDDIGLLEGRNQPTVKLNYLPHLSQVQVGDEVVTAGLGGLFPPGIPVGAVTHIQDSPDGFFKEAVVLPHARLGALRDVLVLQRIEVARPVKVK
jgi:rod shape-determining protein MreC